jgi:deoxyadenosine/deoxycytidine kinase
MISQDFNAKLILERFKDNPFLPKFYEEKNRYAFPLEMSFLADRYQQLSDDLAQYDLFSDFVVSDYDVFKSLIFARITLQEDEYVLYHKLFNIIYKELVKPDLYIYLYQDTERLLENIKIRGRDYEQNIEPEYLMKINKSYLAYIKSQNHIRVKIIDISGKDFVNKREDYLSILEEINAAV